MRRKRALQLLEASTLVAVDCARLDSRHARAAVAHSRRTARTRLARMIRSREAWERAAMGHEAASQVAAAAQQRTHAALDALLGRLTLRSRAAFGPFCGAPASVLKRL